MILLALVVLLNLASYLAFWLDKSRARRDEWRIPESTLLLLAALGGSLGAKLAQRKFRHKTRKEPFRTLLNLIVIGHIALLLALIAYWAGLF